MYDTVSINLTEDPKDLESLEGEEFKLTEEPKIAFNTQQSEPTRNNPYMLRPSEGETFGKTSETIKTDSNVCLKNSVVLILANVKQTFKDKPQDVAQKANEICSPVSKKKNLIDGFTKNLESTIL